MNSVYSFLTRYRFVLNVVLFVLLVLACLVFARDIITAKVRMRQAPADPRENAPHSARLRHLEDYAPAVKNNPFGLPEVELKPLAYKQPAFSSGSQRSSDLSLIGIVAGLETLSCAIITDGSGRQEVVRPGQPVLGIGTLESVEKKEAVVRMPGGGLRKLYLVDKCEKPLYAGSSPDIAKQLGKKEFLVAREKILDAFDNPTKLMTEARLLANTVDGKSEGFILKEVEPGGIYASLGLRNDDILLRINDYNISQPEHVLQALNALRGLDSVDVGIMRAGKRMKLTYQMQ